MRIAHLGPGNFFRAHQAWYTEHAPDAADWGIAAFAGRRGAVARDLAAQDGLYTLLVRAADGDRPEVISAVAAVSAELDDWRRCFARPELALVTTTVTEAGYRRAPDGGLDTEDPEVAADIAALQFEASTARTPRWSPPPASSRSGSRCAARTTCPDMAVVPCDNVPDNGAMVARVVGEMAAAVDPGLAAWIAEHVAFVTTMVDRITPHTTDDDRAAVRERLGWTTPSRSSPSPTSSGCCPGSSRGVAPAGRTSGPGSSTTSCRGSTASCGCSTGRTRSWPTRARCAATRPSKQAIADPVVRGWVEQWWDDAARHLPLPPEEITAYRAALLERYANPRIRHLLRQIAADGSQKVPIRILPTVRADLADGRVPTGAARVLAAWVCHLRGQGAPVADVAAEEFTALAAGELDDAVGRVLARLGVDDARLTAAVTALARELGGN